MPLVHCHRGLSHHAPASLLYWYMLECATMQNNVVLPSKEKVPREGKQRAALGADWTRGGMKQIKVMIEEE